MPVGLLANSKWEGRDYLLLGWRHHQFLQDLPSCGQKLLDVGCSNGDFLVAAREKGYDVYGLDFDRIAIDIGSKKFGLKNLFCGELDDFILKNPSEKFDVITFFEVLEHLDNPGVFFESIKKILKPEGYIAFSVPNRDRWIKESVYFDYPPHHLTRWNTECIKKLLNKYNFNIVKIKTNSEVGVEYFLQNKIRLGIVKRMFTRSLGEQHTRDPKQNEEIIFKRADKLLKIKFKIFKIIAEPLNFVLRMLGAPGVDIYVLAQNRGS